MIELLLVAFFVAAITGLSAWVTLFYLRITRRADSHTIPYKLRAAAKYPPLVIFVVLCASVALAIADTPRYLALTMLGIFLLATFTQLLMVTLALFSVKCREVAAASVEGKAARYIVLAMFFLIVLSFKASFVFWRVLLGLISDDNGKPKPDSSSHGWSFSLDMPKTSKHDPH